MILYFGRRGLEVFFRNFEIYTSLKSEAKLALHLKKKKQCMICTLIRHPFFYSIIKQDQIKHAC